VAKSDESGVGCLAERQAAGCHRVSVLEHDSVWFGEFFHVACDIDEHRYCSQASEEAAGAEGIGDALVDAVFERDFVIDAERIYSSDLNHDDDEVCIFYSFLLFDCGRNFSRDVVVPEHLFGEALHSPEPGLVEVHEGKVGVGQGRCGHDITDECLAKNNTSCSNHRYLFAHFLVSSLLGVRRYLSILEKTTAYFTNKVGGFQVIYVVT